jgi:hypothetical protein
VVIGYIEQIPSHMAYLMDPPVVDNDGTLDKESTSYNDIFDAFRLALKSYHFRERTD